MSRSKDMRDDTERFVRDVDRLLAGHPVEEITDDAYRADLELAHLLDRMQFVPDPRFKSRLRSQLLHQLYEEEVKTMSPIRLFRSLVRPVLVAGLSAMIVLGVVFAASPAARAAAQAAAQELVARFVEVDSPWALFPGGEKQPAPPAVTGAPGAEAGSRTVTLGPEGESLMEGELPVPDVQPSPELLSLEEAQAGLDFEIRVPSVLPDGYAFLGVMPQPEVPDNPPDIGIKPPDGLPKAPEGLPKPLDGLPKAPEGLPEIQKPQVATLIFGNAAGEKLVLSEALLTGPALAEVPLPAGRGGVQDVTVNGQPAQYVEGAWTENGWVSSGHYQLHWQDTEGAMFDLISATLGLEELLPVAESIE
jgi:hypothetical protein